MNKKLIIMRGCSGAGKTTEAKRLAKQCKDEDGVSVICSADDYFIDSLTKAYIFDAKLLFAAHTYCRAKAEGAMEAKADVVIIDNTNTRRRDFELYIDMAKLYGYEVEEVVVGGFDESSLEIYSARNAHGVPKETIKKMAERFEK
jgi:predicted kinase